MVNQENAPVKPHVSDVAQAKSRLISEAGKIDPLAPLRQHPWATIGSATILGAVVGSLLETIRPGRQHRASDPHVSIDDVPLPAANPTILVMLQPLLLRGAKMAASWWMERRRAREQEPASEADTPQVDPNSPTEPASSL